MEQSIAKLEVECMDELKKILDSRFLTYKNGSAKMLTAAESKKRIQKFLQAGHKK